MATFTRRGSATNLTGTTPDDTDVESFLEEDFTYLLRFNPLVATYRRPEKLFWTAPDGELRKYTPDFVVEYKPETKLPTTMVEVKPDFDEKYAHIPRKEDPEFNKLKWAAATREANRKSHVFKVVYASEIRTPLLYNAKYLLRYLERSTSVHRRDQLLDELRRSGQLELGQLLQRVCTGRDDEALTRPCCYRLIAQGLIYTDLESQPLTRSSVLTLAEQQ